MYQGAIARLVNANKEKRTNLGIKCPVHCGKKALFDVIFLAQRGFSAPRLIVGQVVWGPLEKIGLCKGSC